MDAAGHVTSSSPNQSHTLKTRFEQIFQILLFQVAGDVVVGWVNARTGKGEIDDYFLAGSDLKCDDGAESCPDVSKPVKANIVRSLVTNSSNLSVSLQNAFHDSKNRFS